MKQTYDLKKTWDTDQAFELLTRFVGEDATVEIKRISPRRSLNQNSFLHLLLGIFALGTGYSASESKVILKRYACPDVFVYKKKGMTFLRSTADLTKEEMVKVIDIFREFSAGHGIPLPLAEDKEALRYWDNEIQRSAFL